MLPPDERRKYWLLGSDEDRPSRTVGISFVSLLLGEVDTAGGSCAGILCILAADVFVVLLRVLTADNATGDRLRCGNCQSMFCEAIT